MSNPFGMKEISESMFKAKDEFGKKIPKAFENIKETKLDILTQKIEGKRRIVNVNIDGEKVKGEFPKFNSAFDTKLPKELYQASDHEQFKFCTKQLAKKIDGSISLRENFSRNQLEQIINGEPHISGYTWHHNEKEGVMQLVKTKEHDARPHIGGREIWGGGDLNR